MVTKKMKWGSLLALVLSLHLLTGSAWSGPGGKLAFVQRSSKETSILLTDPEKKQVKKLVTLSQDIRTLLPSPDGLHIAYEVQETGQTFPSLWIVNQANKQSKKLVAAEQKGNLFAWLGANRLLITYHGEQGKRILTELHPSTLAQKTICGQGSAYTLSPNQKQVLVQLTATDYRIGLVNIDGSRFTVLTQGGQEYAPAWAPDGKQIAYADPQGIWILPLSTQTKRQLAKVGENPVWLPDGKHLLYEEFDAKNQRSLFLVEASGGKAKKVTRGMQPVLSPNQKLVLFHYSFDLGFFPVSGAWTYYLSYNGRNSKWSSNNQSIAFEQLTRGSNHQLENSNIMVFSLATKKLTPITDSGRATSPVWLDI